MRTVRHYLLGILLFILPVLAATGQYVYVSTGSGQGIRKVSVNTGQCFSDTVISCPGLNYFAIAKHADKFYFTSNAELYEADILNDTIKNCRVLDITPEAMTALTVNNNGVLYSVTVSQLYKWDPSSGSGFVLIGSIPYRSAGDLIFYQGELYMASVSGIVKVDINDPSASTMYIPINSTSIYGMAVLSVDCNQNNVYAFETTSSGVETNMIELDMQNRISKGVTCVLPFGVADAASDVESGGFAGIKLKDIQAGPQCREPGKAVLSVIRVPGLAEYTYTLNGGQSNTTGVFEHLDPGNYHIEITTPGGCYFDTTFNVPFFNEPVPVVQFHQTAQDCTASAKIWFTISPDNGQNKVIHNNTDTVNAGFVFSDLAEGTHHFSIMDKNHCELDTKDVTIVFEVTCDTVYFPSAFTPNNDGRNDVFRGNGNRSVKEYHLTVYDRWGHIVFTTTDIMQGWNGKVKSVEQASGIYIWDASYISKSGILHKRKGTVALLR